MEPTDVPNVTLGTGAADGSAGDSAEQQSCPTETPLPLSTLHITVKEPWTCIYPMRPIEEQTSTGVTPQSTDIDSSGESACKLLSTPTTAPSDVISLDQKTENVVDTVSSADSNVPFHQQDVEMADVSVLQSQQSQELQLQQQQRQQEQQQQQQPELSGYSEGSFSWPSYQTPDQYSKFKETVGQYMTSLGHSYCGDAVAVATKEFAATRDNYLRGCKWSPDGNFILTNSNDDMMRVFTVSEDILTGVHSDDTELVCSTKVQESELVYDYCWFPALDVTQPDTCCFALSCRDTPIHLYNSLTGDLVCTYRPYNQADEVVAAHSIGFTCDGRYLLSGFNKMIRIFHTSRPGRDFVAIPTTVKDRVTQETKGQQGIISCFAAHPSDPAIFAAGSFRGDVALYSAPSGGMNSLFRGQQGGVTHMMFSRDGLRLYAGGRKDPEINCWDIRNPGKLLYVMYRYVRTNQRMYFDLDSTGKWLFSGNHNGKVSVWDVESTPHDNPVTGWPQIDPIANFQAHRDATNGCSLSPKQPLLATCSGQRHFPLDEIISDDDDDSDDGESAVKRTREKTDVENSLRIWHLKLPAPTGQQQGAVS